MTLAVPVVAHPSELTFGPDDVVIVGVKGQDTPGVIDALGESASPDTPIVCLQNGVANERAFLRRWPSVHAVTVMAPTTHLQPGVVQASTRNAVAILDVGRWPSGVDDVSEAVAAAFRSSGFQSLARPDIARWKYTKLLLNLGNPIDALSPRGDDATRLHQLARAEGEAVLAAAGIDHVTDAEDKARRGDWLQLAPVGNGRRPGGSTWQSLARGTPVEVDYLNGEIVLLGRLHGVPAPVNEMLQRAAHEAAAAGAAPGSVPAGDLLSRI